MKLRLLLFAVCAMALGDAAAQNALIDYQGYAWETGGVPPSNATDVLSIVGVVDDLDTRLGVNLLLEEVTLYVTNLISSGQVDVGGGLLNIVYTGGTIELYRDPSKDHDYGITPPNATAPSSFTNGTLLLGGTLSSFFMYYDPSTGTGAYEATAQFTSGTGLTALNQLNADAYTFGGTARQWRRRRQRAAGLRPASGRRHRSHGPVGVERQSWSGIKEMYRR
jgi:hypothetical protein